MSATLRQFPYSGLSMPGEIFHDREQARAAAARLIRRRRRAGYPVHTIKRGAEWEVCEPEGCAMVPDACGLITLRIVTHKCSECGAEYIDAESAATCCTRPDWCDDERDLDEENYNRELLRDE